MNKYVLGLVIILAVSFASFKFGQKSVKPVEADGAGAEEQVKEELVELTRADFEEYQKLKTLEERYQKADEILGKVVTLFLADLGIRLAYKPVPAAQLQSSCEPTHPVVNQPPAAPMPVAPVAFAGTPVPKTTANPGWQGLEGSVLREQDVTDALRTLKKMEIPDITATVQSGKPLNRREALGIEGHFVGEIRFFDRKTHKSDWGIEWEIGLKHRGAKFDGAGYIRIVDRADGKQLSRTSFESGALKDFTKADGSRGLIVNVYGDDGFIQIYPLGGNKDIWIGNFYEKVRLGKFEMSGQVQLNRVR